MPRSYPPPPDVRVVAQDGPAVEDAVQAVTGGESPYCRRCGEWTTVRPQGLAGLLDHVPDHLCGTTVEVQPRTTTRDLTTPFA